jgi:hypothetical protein
MPVNQLAPQHDRRLREERRPRHPYPRPSPAREGPPCHRLPGGGVVVVYRSGDWWAWWGLRPAAGRLPHDRARHPGGREPGAPGAGVLR